jgi:hypothetical protein
MTGDLSTAQWHYATMAACKRKATRSSQTFTALFIEIDSQW